MKVDIHDARVCKLGEGPLWHPLRKQLFWFDIVEKKLLSQDSSGQISWDFDTPVSAAGWVDNDSLLVASSSGLFHFSLSDGSRKLVCHLEHQNDVTRSNDGRADPWGGFWIGTMGRCAETGAGAIYRYYQGQLRKLFPDITVSNAICFAPDRSHAYYTDTATAKVMKIALDRTGWPAGAPEVFLDLSSDRLNPDGAIVDASGALWIAQWGAARVAVYDKHGNYQREIPLPAHNVTCPAFGGDDFSTLFVTSATTSVPADLLATTETQGMVFKLSNAGKGLPEPRVML